MLDLSIEAKKVLEKNQKDFQKWLRKQGSQPYSEEYKEIITYLVSLGYYHHRRGQNGDG